tara:strand:- start:435 stop:806 length:372 start_codon:yes stop_codon:yes gene_type:complete
MEYDLINGLGSAIDNVYSYSSEDGTRKTKAKLVDNQMHITYVTILNSGKELELQYQMIRLKKESNEMINSRLRTIKQEFKKDAGRTLTTKKVGMSDDIETLTVSPYSLMRKLKYSCTYKYEVK